MRRKDIVASDEREHGNLYHPEADPPLVEKKRLLRSFHSLAMTFHHGLAGKNEGGKGRFQIFLAKDLLNIGLEFFDLLFGFGEGLVQFQYKAEGVNRLGKHAIGFVG